MLLISLPPMDQQATKPVIEIRERLERRVDRDFDSGIRDNRSDLLSRFRIGTELVLSPDWKATLQYQYAHGLAWTPSRNFSTWNSDAYQAFVETKENGWTYTIGRQRLILGNQRLIGSLEWSNTGRSFDAVRLRSARWDLWGGKIAVANPKPRDARVFGAVNTNRFGMTSLIHKSDKTTTGKVRVTTLDHLWSARRRDTTYEVEAAIQTGQTAGKDQEAWAVHARATRSVAAGTSAFAEFNTSSGGASSDKVRTFDNLYPANHDKYGIMDLQGWRNMTELAVGVERTAAMGLLLRGSWRLLGLYDAKDAWYGAGGAPNRFSGGPFVDPLGQSGRDVGQEIDLEAVWTPRKDLSVQAGIGVFLPGRFVKSVAGTSDRQVWGFFSIQQRI